MSLAISFSDYGASKKINIYYYLEEVKVMKSTVFDTDSYEQDLALIMLDSIMKKQLISSKTYRSVKKMIEEDTDGS